MWRSRYLLATAIASVVTLAGAGPADAGMTKKLFATQTAATVDLPANATGGARVAGILDAQALDAATLEIALPDGETLIALQTHVSSDLRLDARTWTGRIVGSPGDLAFLAERRGTIAGFLSSQNRIFEILPVASGQHVLFEAMSPRMTVTDAVSVPLLPSPGKQRFGGSVVGSLSAAFVPVVHDLLVVYTAAAGSERTIATLESLIIAAVESANASYRQSSVNVTLSLVGMRVAEVAEEPSLVDTLHALSCDAHCMTMRNSMGADMVLLVTASEDEEWCGYAYIMDSCTTEFAPFAFAVVRLDCLSGRVLTHELGHVQGVAHDRDTGGNAGAFPYAHGYRRCVQDETAFHDIMAYRCTGMPSAALTTFASPDIFYQGYPTGISYELDPAHSADAARALNATGPTVAEFRITGLTPPSGPVSLSAIMSSTGSVDLTWTDLANDEAGFMIERTTDGVNFAQTARLSANITRHTDATTNSITVYSYRVAAYNSAGLSQYSNVATAKATNGGNGGGGHGGNGGGAVDAWLVIAGLLLTLSHHASWARLRH